MIFICCCNFCFRATYQLYSQTYSTLNFYNLSNFPAGKKEIIIQRDYGGTFSLAESIKMGGIGIGGMTYSKGLHQLDNFQGSNSLRCNVEMYRDGLGIYMKSYRYSFLMMMHSSEIISIQMFKDPDILNLGENSLFLTLLRRGIPYVYAKWGLMESEIIKQHTPKLKIMLSDMESYYFDIQRRNPFKISRFFEKSHISEVFQESYLDYKNVNS